MPLLENIKQCFRRPKKQSLRPSIDHGPEATTAAPLNNPEAHGEGVPLGPLDLGASPEPHPAPVNDSLISAPPPASSSPPAMPFAANHHADTSRHEAVLRTPSNCSAPSAATHGANHKIKETAWSGFKLLVGLVNASVDAFGPLKSAVSGFEKCIEIYDRIAQSREEYRLLRNELNALFTDVYNSLNGSTLEITTVVKSLFRGIEQEAAFVLGKEARNGFERVVQSIEDQNEVLECYRRIQNLVLRVSLNVNINTWKIVDTMATEHRLEKLSPSHLAWYSSASSTDLQRRECTPNTRVKVMEQLRAWLAKDGIQKIYWLNGMAGTGKTTIAYSLCKYLDDMNTLAASFFCSRQLPECRNVNFIIPTIAYQLAALSHPFKCALSRAIEQNPSAHTRQLSEQFAKLLVGPLKAVAETIPSNLVVVIDALDECENMEGVAQMLNALFTHASDLPLRFFTTSRSEPKIQSRMMSLEGEHMRLKMHLHELESSIVKEDIKTYFQVELEHVVLSSRDLESLCNRSGVLFIHAATAVRYILDQDSSWSAKRLKMVLNASKASTDSTYKEVDALYTAILNEAFEGTKLEQDEKASIYDVLHIAVCAQEPLTTDTMAELLGVFGGNSVYAALRLLFAVLDVSETTGLVTTLHESFPDFLFDQARSKDFYCDKAQRHAQLALRCFDRVSIVRPQFNICGLESSYVFDKEVSDLEERVKKVISTGLFYACKYWLDHLMLATLSNKELDELYSFLCKRLLLWMEIMNLKKQLEAGVGILARLEAWTQSMKRPEGLHELAEDGWRFAIGVTSSTIVDSTPHIYVSALAFWPMRRAVSKCYTEHFEGLIEITGPAQQKREAAPLAVCMNGASVISLACSPDGLRIASGSGDNVRIWNVHSGQNIGKPLHGHSSHVMSVAYSPDGSRIVSGSWDSTICIWNAHTGKITGKALEGHTSGVLSVAYSPDGSRIVSGSWDNTMCIWNAHTGQAIGEPLQGHNDAVRSVAYSPDGLRIISGSDDNAMRIWNAHTGQPIGESLRGHTDAVRSVAYSPSGSRIVSGSDDHTVRIWNANTGQLLGEPLQGHTDAVLSVAYSPDGSRIVSGSSDNTIRVWDAHTARIIDKPLKGHISSVNWVAYSPDGSRIVSGSEDNAIHIWHAHTAHVIGEPLQGHTRGVRSVTFSPDCSRIVSGSEDKTVCIWNAHTGQLIGEPLKGHTSYVMSAAYSPDGSRIACGSYDNTIRIWDAKNGQRVGECLEGHTLGVWSVAYSPDGSRIVSGSDDKTIRIWNALTGQLIGEPLEGHTSSVKSAAYSPDGSYIISGSDDKTIRIWDAHSAQIIGEPLQGHTNAVRSVAYSPDGSRIVSGSVDKTMRIWSAHTGKLIGKPLGGHTATVMSAAYSPDGSYIVSGSDDNTIRIWDANTGQLIGEPLRGHTSYVRSVAYSPDGSRIVSGSEDHTIRIWDAQTGQLIGEPLQGHTEPAYSVAYSPHKSRIVSGSQDYTIPSWHPHAGQSTIRLEQPCASTTDSSSLFGPFLQVSSTQKPGNSPPHDTWVLREDGWIVTSNSELLIWVPRELRGAALMRSNTILAISAEGWLRPDFRKALVGPRWREMRS